MAMSRRELCSLLPAAAILPLAAELHASASANAELPSAWYPFADLPVRNNPNGSQTRHILAGKLATGESLEVHATMLPPGGMPHPPHHHVHSEMWLIREGTLELTINGKSQRLGPGSVGFVHSNEEHGVKNVGDAPAHYFVVAVGPTAGAV